LLTGGELMPELPTNAARARFKAINPHFVVGDVVAEAEYYRDVLGFKILGYFGEPPVFAMVARDNAEIQFSKVDEGAEVSPNVSRNKIALDAYVWVDDVDRLYGELQAKGAKILEKPTQRVYNCYEMKVEDPYGFRLVFSQDNSDK
jgi:uncharacterized glyoxalase superfamily protein PhnB